MSQKFIPHSAFRFLTHPLIHTRIRICRIFIKQEIFFLQAREQLELSEKKKSLDCYYSMLLLFRSRLINGINRIRRTRNLSCGNNSDSDGSEMVQVWEFQVSVLLLLLFGTVS